MHDPWLDRLSDYIDGELTAAEARALEAHLVTCDECATTLAGLRQVVALAHDLEAPEPATDLWPGIAAGIAGTRLTAHAGSGSDEQAAAIPFREPRRSALRQARFSLSIPQLAAAAAILMAVGAGAVWLLGPAAHPPATRIAAAEPMDGLVVMNAGAVPEHTRLVTAVPEPAGYASDVARLEEALDSSRDRLDPATVEIIERSIESIDQAIADARAALDADPGNPHLHRQLESTMQKKLDMLRRASRAQRVGT